MKKSQLALAVICCFTASELFANNTEFDPSIESITVNASRSERDINEIASTVTVINSETIDQQLVNDIQKLVRYEPGVVVEGSGRFGLSGFNIRGINEDRILMLVDGAPLADEFSFGPALSARRDFVDVDLVDRVEIIRGPASTLYGSDAIGGVVSFITRDPDQLVNESNSFGGKVKAGYASISDEFAFNAQLASVYEDWSWLLNVSKRQSSETSNYFNDNGETGDARKAANPQDNESDAAQLKVVYAPNEQHKLEVLIDYIDSQSETDVLSVANTYVYSTLINERTGIDERSRERVQINYSFKNSNLLFDKANLSAYYQASNTHQLTLDERFGGVLETFFVPTLLDRSRESSFDQDVSGIIAQFDKEFTTGDTEHYLIYGTELQYTDSEALRLGSTVIQETGAQATEFSVFPARDFPISEAKEWSVFVHDEITLLNDTLIISPGLRYDAFELAPLPDEIFETANPGVETVPFEDSQLSFKLGAVYKLSEQTNAWLQFAQGFRIPPYDDLNVGFTNYAGGYTSVANPDLKPESVDSWEIGIRKQAETVSWSVSAYYNDYENFIESLASNGYDFDLGLLVFQAQNRDAVTIQGIDAQATWYLSESFEALEGWKIQTALTWLESEDKSTGEEIESMIPPQAVMGIGYTNEEKGFAIELMGTFVARSDAQNDPSLFEAPGYAKFDLLANYALSESININAGVFNLLDREIYNGTETRGLSIDEDPSFYSSAGRNFAINATFSF